MENSYKNLDETDAFKQLCTLPPVMDMNTHLTAELVQTAQVPMGEDLTYNYAAKAVDEAILATLQRLADEMAVVDQYRELLGGAVMNGSEQRKVLHHLTRGQVGPIVEWQGRDLGSFYVTQQQRVADFARRVHAGEIRGSGGDRFTHLCQIGIGGSDLGPRALYLALQHGARCRGSQFMTASFISNVDPDDAAQNLANMDLATTMFILVSKSGTTQETLTNETIVRHALQQQGLDPAAHLLAVTAENSPLANGEDYLESFYIDDFVGGRFSSTSAVGGTLLTLAFGAELFAELLAGAHQQDQLALNSDILANPALLDALIGVYERNCLGYPCTAVLPYSQALSRFPAHLQQLDMESNGKSVNRYGQPLNYATGAVIFGEAGTNGQHSFYQLLHQGSDIIPLQFIGFRHAHGDDGLNVDGCSSQDKLNANLVAQIVAFAKGRDSEEPNRVFAGQRPSSLIYAERLTPRIVGALLAHFENKVMFQGFLWNVNSFDQEGVQLGKVLTQQLLTGCTRDAVLQGYAAYLGVLQP
ncbi:MAG: glucose-6-phosphate isomerase [Thermodesulfobacteriota bacterium]|nr:glucose-6-phosphate isomerase [Thermodesulfobacteriota bacterium]